MKVLLIAIITFFASLFSLSAVVLPVIRPCETDFIYGSDCNIPWDTTVKYDTIYCYDLSPCPPSCPSSSCQFIIQYFDRFINCEGDTNPEWYDVQITYVYTSDSCETCFASLKERLERKFINKRNQAVKDRFKFVWYYPNDPPTKIYCYYQHHFTTRGNCYPTVGGDTLVPCSAERCCARYVKICYDSDGIVIEDSTQISGDILFPDPVLDSTRAPGYSIPCTEIGCDNSARPKCGKYPIYNQIDVVCNNVLPCNNGVWQEDSILVDRGMFGCPGCSAFVYFKKRINLCDVAYHDIQITGFKFLDSANCSFCPTLFNFPAFYWFNVNQIISNEAGLNLDQGECDTNYRVLHYSCWARRSNDTMSYDPCVTTGCCWSKYIACKDSNNSVSVTKIDSSQASGTCFNITAPCIYICDEPGMPKQSVGENIKEIIKQDIIVHIKPNPSTGLFNCFISNVVNLEMKFIIYNQLGVKVFQKDLYNTKYYANFDFDISKQPNGVYVYSLESNNIPVFNGIINLIK